MTVFYVIAAVTLMVVVALDLLVVRRARRTTPEILAHGAFYLLLAMGASVAIYFLYHGHVLGAGMRNADELITGGEASLQFLASFLIELVLGLDMVFVIVAVFAHVRVRERSRHAVLLWTVPIAMILRTGLVLGTGALFHRYEWIKFILAAMLFIAAIRMTLIRRENLDPEKNIVYRLLRRFVPITARDDDSALLTQVEGKPALTPLVVPVLLIVTADAFLAWDSIPASFALTREPFLIISASVTAMLCLRALQPALETIIARLRYFKIGMAMLLAFCAAVIAIPTSQFRGIVQTLPGITHDLASTVQSPSTTNTLQRLVFLVISVIVGVLIAAAFGGHTAQSEISPLGNDADKIARDALSRIRKVGVFIIGVTGLIFGAIMAIGPGPGIPVLLIAMLVLASEFVWARRVVNKYRPMAEEATRKAVVETRRRFRPWMFISMILFTIAAAVAVGWFFPKVHPAMIISAAVPMVAGQFFLGYFAYFHKDQSTPDA